MKLILPLLVVIPFVSNGQNKGTDKLTLVHADKTSTRPAKAQEGETKKLKDNTVYYGNVQFQVGMSYINCDSAVLNENISDVTAYHVKVTNSESFDVKADQMAFSTKTRKGMLNSNVVVAAKNEMVVGTSDALELDFSEDVFRIGKGNLSSPEPPKSK